MKTDLRDEEKMLDPSTIAESERAYLLGLDDVLPLLAEPVTGAALRRRRDRLEGQAGSYPLLDGLPILFPAQVAAHIGPLGLDVPAGGDDALLKYLHISGLKHFHEPTNSEHADPAFLRHVHRARELLREAVGTVLDVGCDVPSISHALFPREAAYVGLDPTYAERGEFRVVGMAEFLPFADEAFDNVALLTTLDHVLDHHMAIDEAWRVLRPGGTLYLATLIWTSSAEVVRDHVHFHHFRDYEILGAISRFQLRQLRRYEWKGDRHRHSWYLAAVK